MKEILFFAYYPTDTTSQEGMNQRILSVDEEFRDWHRTYVYVSWTRYWHRQHDSLSERNVDVYRVNFLAHIAFIMGMISRHRNIYFHSVYNFLKLYFYSFRNKVVTLDVHGSVPEEEAFNDRRLYAAVLDRAEKKLFRQTTNFIYVSQEMQDFYDEKYPTIMNGKHKVLKPICSHTVLADPSEQEVDDLRRELGIKPDDVVFIYSGNIQKWQNVVLTIQTMKRNARPNHVFIFLTGAPEGMQKLLAEQQADGLRCTVRKVLPTELGRYYALSHYGYILRDENILNRVAAPTKMIEYLYFGITPIVMYDRIGDTLKFGYEHVAYDADLTVLTPRKSEKNREVARILSTRNLNISLSALYAES